jgi:hypothetical protein
MVKIFKNVSIGALGAVLLTGLALPSATALTVKESPPCNFRKFVGRCHFKSYFGTNK